MNLRYRSIAGLLGLAVLGVIGASAQCRADAAPYAVTRRFAIGGTGGWDALAADPGAQLVYVSHADRVHVIDAATGTQRGLIDDTPGVHGIALAPEVGRGYVTAGSTSVVKVFDLKTRATVTTIPVGKGPDAILYDAGSRRVFAFNEGSRDVTAIDANTNTVVGSMDLGGKPEFAAADGHGGIYVNIEDRSEIVAFDARTLKVLKRWPLGPCFEPTGIAIDAAHRRLFSVCHNRTMVVVNADDGSIVQTLPIGERVDGAAFDAGTSTAFSSNADGTLTIVHEDDPDHYQIVQTLETQRGARTLALDTATHRLYLPTASFEPAPAATPAGAYKRPAIRPDTFVLLVVDRVPK